MTLDCDEQERRIQWYLKRFQTENVGSLMGRELHRNCYLSIIQGLPPATVRSVSHPRKYYRPKVKQKRLQSESNSMVMLNLNSPINKISFDSSSTMDNDTENFYCIKGIDNNIDKTRSDDELNISISNDKHPIPLGDLTNMNLVRNMIIDGANEPSLDFSIDVYDYNCQRVSEQTFIMSESNSLTESVNICPVPNETNNNSVFSCSSISSPVKIDLDSTTSIDISIEHQPQPMISFPELRSSTEFINSNNDLSSDLSIDIDVKNELFSMDLVEAQPIDSFFPLTSTEKNIRAKRFSPRNQDIIDNLNFSDSSTDHSFTSDFDLTTSTSRNEKNASSSTSLSRNVHRERNGSKYSHQQDKSSDRSKHSRRRKETSTESMFRTSFIRNLLETRYEGMLHFDKLNNYDGVYVGLADVSMYVRMAISTSSVWKRTERDDKHTEQEACEAMIDTIELLRQSIKNQAFVF